MMQHKGRLQGGEIALRCAKVLLIAFAAAALLEMGTLFGSPLEDSVLPWNWHKKRFLVFFAISACAVAALYAAHAGHSIASRWQAAKAADEADKRAVLLAAIGCCIGLAATAVLLLISRSTGADTRVPVFVVFCIMAAWALFSLRSIIVRAFEWAFLVLVLFAGILSCLFMPATPEIIWDGAIHYDWANGMSYVLDAQYDQADQFASTPAIFSLAGFSDYTSWSSSSGEVWHTGMDKENLDEIALFFNGADPDAVASLSGTACMNDSTYLTVSFIGHLPNAIGLWIGRLLHLAPTGRFLVSRLSNLFLYAFVFFLAMRRLRYGKEIVSIAALFPTCIFLVSNFSYDAMNVSLISLSFCAFVGELQQPYKTLSLKGSLWIFIPFFLGVLIKATFFPLALVFLFMPRGKFENGAGRVEYIAGVFGVMALLLLSFALPFLATMFSGVTVGDTRGGDVGAGSQISYILEDPARFAAVLAGFIISFLNPVDVLGLLPNYSSYLFPDWTTRALLLGFAFTLLLWASVVSVCMHTRKPVSGKYSAVMLAAGLIVFVLIAAWMYVAFTPIGSSVIKGVQLRYLLPLVVPTLLMVFASAPVERTRPAPAFALFAAGAQFALLAASVASAFLL